MKKILSIDGGGIRGLIPAIILAELERRSNKSCYKMFDLIAGTSTGAILAASLAKMNPYSALDVVNFYKNNGSLIFKNNSFHLAKTIDGLYGPKYPSNNILNILSTYFTGKLSECITKLLVPSYNISDQKAYFFKSHYAVVDPADDFNLFDVLAASTAAPTYFSPHRIGDNLYADGGLVAYNPTMCVIVEAMRLWPGEEISIVSLGTGVIPVNMNGAITWGTFGWIKPIIDVCFSDAVIDYEVRQLNPKNYWRLQSVVPAVLALDAVSEMESIENIGNAMVTQYTIELDNIVSVLTQ